MRVKMRRREAQHTRNHADGCVCAGLLSLWSSTISKSSTSSGTPQTHPDDTHSLSKYYMNDCTGRPYYMNVRRPRPLPNQTETAIVLPLSLSLSLSLSSWGRGLVLPGRGHGEVWFT